MVSKGKTLEMNDGEKWRLTYELFIPETLHGTKKFTHIFQIKTVGKNAAGPFFTISLSRSGDGERLRFRPFGSKDNSDIGSVDLDEIRDKWITVDMTFEIGENGSAHCVLRDGVGADAAVLLDESRGNVQIPVLEGQRARFKWGIYRSIESAQSDIIDTFLLVRNYQALKV
jgi:hypothetical protein